MSKTSAGRAMLSAAKPMDLEDGLFSEDRWSELLVAAGRGEKASFERLAREARTGMRLRALRVLNNVHDADEVVQESLLEAWCTASRYDPRRGGARNWLATIVRHRAIDLIRRTTTRRQREHRVAVQHRSVDMDDTAELVLIQADHDAVRDALARLTERQQQAIRLVYYDGMTNNEAAAILRIPVATLKTRLHDGICRLRRIVNSTNGQDAERLSS